MALFHVPVSLMWTANMGFYRHDAWVPAAPSPVLFPLQPSIEMTTPMFWPPGFALNKNSFSKKVVHLSSMVCTAGHDCGPLILDITPPQPANLKYPVMWLNSSRKFILTASSVDHDGKKVACAAVWPPIPMMTCGDPISAPVAMIHTNLINSEKVVVSLADLLIGLATLAISMVIDYAFSRMGKQDDPFSNVNIGKEYDKALMSLLTGGLPTSRKGLEKWAANAAAGIGLSIFGTDNEGNFQWQWPNVEFSMGRRTVGYNFEKGEGKVGSDYGFVKTEVVSSTTEGISVGGSAFGFGF